MSPETITEKRSASANHCYRCRKSAELQHLGRDCCTRCFSTVIEQRVKRQILLLPKKIGESQAKGVLTQALLKRLKMVYSSQGSEEMLEDITATDLVIRWFLNLFENKTEKIPLSIVTCITENEAKLYAQIRNLKWSAPVHPQTAKQFVENATGGDDHLILACARNILEMERVIQCQNE